MKVSTVLSAFCCALIIGACSETSSPTSPQTTPNYSLSGRTQSTLVAIAGEGRGVVEVATTAHDVVGPGTFDVQGTANVHGASGAVTFRVLRRVDLNANGSCTGATWVNLPGSPTPMLTTSTGGAGSLHFEISRGLPFVDGVSFDVQWRLEGSDGSILLSDCLTPTVK